MKSAQFVVMDPVGLHARPAALFVKLANKFSSNVSICNVSTSGKWANAKSILSVLTCGVKQGDQIEVRAEGVDEAEAVEALQKLVASNFAESAD
ncbi:MAG: HPr family phosphocarrier protein [Byssovorax cruenta]|jgi:phosphotransferase system HPr (HPr) family protein